jgi:hypothetical protein
MEQNIIANSINVHKIQFLSEFYEYFLFQTIFYKKYPNDTFL